MNYTLDTAAIRRRFEQAIIGIRQDGTMAVLVQNNDNTLFDLVTGRQYGTGFGIVPAIDAFPTLIRPGDRCEVSARGTKWHNRMFLGFSGYADVPFGVRESDDHSGEYSAVIAFSHIRPLPAAETEAKTNHNTVFDEIRAKLSQISEVDLARAFEEPLHKVEKENESLRAARKNVCPNPNVIYGSGSTYCHAVFLARLTAAEHELAAIRAEMKQVQK
jgi:hypothetical protein